MEPAYPYDIAHFLSEDVHGKNREHDNLLHASSHLTCPLRHALLAVAGAPRRESDLTTDLRLATGTFWHLRMGKAHVKRGAAVMLEVNLTPWLPPGWSGTADAIAWSPEHQAFVLADLKTVMGDAARWKGIYGADEHHVWQVSLYWWALRKMGLPLVKECDILYLPITKAASENLAEPVWVTVEPLPGDVLAPVLRERTEAREAYLRVLAEQAIPFGEEPDYCLDYLNTVAPPPEREQKLVWLKDYRRWDVRLVPGFAMRYCDYDEPYCTCHTYPGAEKIGDWRVDDAGQLVYSVREGYEDVAPTVKPDESEVRKRGR